MITSVRIVSPIIDTPSRMPDANATTAVTAMTVGRIAPRLRRSRKNVIPSSKRVCAMTGDEERQAEDEEHRVRMDEIVQPAERQQVLLHPGASSAVCGISTCHAEVARPMKVATMTSSMP